jgi:hypothetical protein
MTRKKKFHVLAESINSIPSSYLAIPPPERAFLTRAPPLFFPARTPLATLRANQSTLHEVVINKL